MGVRYGAGWHPRDYGDTNPIVTPRRSGLGGGHQTPYFHQLVGKNNLFPPQKIYLNYYFLIILIFWRFNPSLGGKAAIFLLISFTQGLGLGDYPKSCPLPNAQAFNPFLPGAGCCNLPLLPPSPSLLSSGWMIPRGPSPGFGEFHI